MGTASSPITELNLVTNQSGGAAYYNAGMSAGEPLYGIRFLIKVGKKRDGSIFSGVSQEDADIDRIIDLINKLHTIGPLDRGCRGHPLQRTS